MIKMQGLCQVCGYSITVRSGLVVRHGCVGGWFFGRCGGVGNPPMQLDVKLTEATIEGIRTDLAGLGLQRDRIRTGLEVPAFAPASGPAGRYGGQRVPFPEASAENQALAVRTRLADLSARAVMGAKMIEWLETRKLDVGGTALKTIGVVKTYQPIPHGERKGNLTAQYTINGVVLCRNDEGEAVSVKLAVWNKLQIKA